MSRNLLALSKSNQLYLKYQNSSLIETNVLDTNIILVNSACLSMICTERGTLSLIRVIRKKKRKVSLVMLEHNRCTDIHA